MMKSGWLATVAFAALTTAVMPASAGKQTKQDQRDQEIQELKARLEKLEQQSADEKIEQSARLKKVEDAQDAVQWSFNDGRPTIRSGDGRFEMSLRGRIQLDWAAYDQDPSDFGLGYGALNNCDATNPLCDLGSGAVFRRVRFGIEGKFFKDFIYELRFDFAGSDVEGGGVINIARIGYVGIPGLRIQAGALQPMMTLADATSSAELVTMERAAVITTVVGAFGGDNSRRGVEVTYQKENLLMDGDNFVISGAFTGNRTSGLGGCENAGHSSTPGTTNSADDECTQLLGRIAYRLWSDGTSNVQIGATGAEILSLQGKDAGGDRLLRFRERPEVRVSGDRFVDTGSIPATGGSLYGFEAGMNWENFYLAGEWYRWTIERDNTTLATAGADPSFSGWYIEGEWIFTGENKRYASAGTNNNVGVWRGPSVASPFSLGGGLGAWSLSARYSNLDLNWREGAANACTAFAQCIRGGEQNVLNIGLNWYLNSNLKLVTEYAMVDIDRRTNGADNALTTAVENSLDADFDIVQGRLQFTF